MKSKLIFTSILACLMAVLVGCKDDSHLYVANESNCTEKHFIEIGALHVSSAMVKPEVREKSEKLAKSCIDFYLRDFTINYDNCVTVDNPFFKALRAKKVLYVVERDIWEKCEAFKDPTDTRYMPTEENCTYAYQNKLPAGPGKDQLRKACDDISIERYRAQQRELEENMAKGIICPFNVCPPAPENTQ